MTHNPVFDIFYKKAQHRVRTVHDITFEQRTKAIRYLGLLKQFTVASFDPNHDKEALKKVKDEMDSIVSYLGEDAMVIINLVGGGVENVSPMQDGGYWQLRKYLDDAQYGHHPYYGEIDGKSVGMWVLKAIEKYAPLLKQEYGDDEFKKLVANICDNSSFLYAVLHDNNLIDVMNYFVHLQR